MSEDIVKRLRRMADLAPLSAVNTKEALRDAADEIERLRKENAEVRHQRNQAVESAYEGQRRAQMPLALVKIDELEARVARIERRHQRIDEECRDLLDASKAFSEAYAKVIGADAAPQPYPKTSGTPPSGDSSG
jgi:uncharacterized protein (UPF0335 family)